MPDKKLHKKPFIDLSRRISFIGGIANDTPEPATTAGGGIDMEKKRIYGAVACSEGEARGHGVWINQNFLTELVRLGQNPVFCHIAHFNSCAGHDPLQTVLGVACNFRLSGKVVLCDIEFEETALNKDSIDHILKLAAKHPDKFGMSISFMPKTERRKDPFYEEGGDGYDPDNPDEDYMYYEEEVYDGEENGLKCVTIAQLFANDFVQDPACQDTLFSETSLGAAVEKVKRYSKIPLFDRAIKTFFKTFFVQQPDVFAEIEKQVRELKPDYPQVQPQSKTESLTENQNKMNLNFKNKAKTKAAKTAFGEDTIADGSTVRWPGDGQPMIGDTLTMVAEDGSETPCEPGIYQTTGGWEIATGDGGVITGVQMVPNEQLSREEIAALQKQLQQVQGQLMKLETRQKNHQAAIEEMEANEDLLKGKLDTRTAKDTQRKNLNKPSLAEVAAGIELLREGFRQQQMAKNGTPYTGNNPVVLEYRADKNQHNFGSGVDPSGLAAACQDYLTELIPTYLYEDMYLQNTTDLYDRMPYEAGNLRNVKLPLIYAQGDPDNTTNSIFQADTNDCVRPDNTIEMVPTEKTMTVTACAASLEICPKKWAQFFNGRWYANYQTIPMESQLMLLVMNIIRANLIKELINGDTTAGYCTNGIVKIITGDLANIPTAQKFATHTNWTDSNTYDFIDEAIAAYPVKWESPDPQGNEPAIKMYLAYTVWKKFWRNADALNKYHLNPYKGGSDKLIAPMGTGNVSFVPVTNLNRTTAGNDTGLYFIMPMEHLFTLRSDRDAISQPDVYYDGKDKKYYVDFYKYIGTQYPYSDAIVTNIQ